MKIYTDPFSYDIIELTYWDIIKILFGKTVKHSSIRIVLNLYSNHPRKHFDPL